MIRSSRTSKRRLSGSRRLASRPEACEARTLLSATDVLVVDVRPAEALEECLSAEDSAAAVESAELIQYDEYVVEPLEGELPYDPTEFVSFLSDSIDPAIEASESGPSESDFSKQIVTPDDFAPRGWDPAWASCWLVSVDDVPGGEWTPDDAPVEGEFVDNETLDLEPSEPGDFFDGPMPEGWDPSWLFRDFTVGGDPVDDYLPTPIGAEPDPSWGGWADGPGGEQVDGVGPEGEFVDVTTTQVEDFSELSPEDQEWIRNFIDFTDDLLNQSGDPTGPDGEIVLYPYDPILMTFGEGGPEGPVAGEAVGGGFGESPDDKGIELEIPEGEYEHLILADGESEFPVDFGVEIMAFMSMVNDSVGGAEVQRSLTLSPAVDSPALAGAPQIAAPRIQPIQSRVAPLFRSTEISPVAGSTNNRVDRSLPEVTTVPARPVAAAPRTRPTSFGVPAVTTNSEHELGLTPLFEFSDDSDAPDVNPVPLNELPNADEADVSDAAAHATPERSTVTVQPTRSDRPAVTVAQSRARSVSIDQFMSLFAQDSFIA